MNNAYEAFASNPRYAPGGLEEEIDREEIKEAQQKDVQASSVAKLDDMVVKPQESTELNDRQSAVKMHENILSALNSATRISRDVTGGMRKALDNTLAFVVGRDNLDAGNDWVRENMPAWTEISSQIDKGLAPSGKASEVTQDMSQFMVPFGLYMKGLGGLAAANNVQAGMITKSIIADLVTSGTALDPHMERLSAYAKSIGVDNRINDWLADNENETESEGRLKNIIDSAGTAGVMGAGFIGAAMTLKGLWRAGKAIKGKPVTEIGKPASDVPKGQTGSLPTKAKSLEAPEIPKPTKQKELPKQFKKSPKLPKTKSKSDGEK